MSHFARIENNIVQEVITAEQAFVDTLPGTWLQTSYNTRGGQHYDPLTGQPDGQHAIRKNFAGKGYSYDSQRDAFIPPQPYVDWILNETTCLWEPPIPHPTTGNYLWDQVAHEWYIPQKDSDGNWIFRD